MSGAGPSCHAARRGIREAANTAVGMEGTQPVTLCAPGRNPAERRRNTLRNQQQKERLADEMPKLRKTQ